LTTPQRARVMSGMVGGTGGGFEDWSVYLGARVRTARIGKTKALLNRNGEEKERNRTTEGREQGQNNPVEAEREEIWRAKGRNGAHDDLTKTADSRRSPTAASLSMTAASLSMDSSANAFGRTGRDDRSCSVVLVGRKWTFRPEAEIERER